MISPQPEFASQQFANDKYFCSESSAGVKKNDEIFIVSFRIFPVIKIALKARFPLSVIT